MHYTAPGILCVSIRRPKRDQRVQRVRSSCGNRAGAKRVERRPDALFLVEVVTLVALDSALTAFVAADVVVAAVAVVALSAVVVAKRLRRLAEEAKAESAQSATSSATGDAKIVDT